MGPTALFVLLWSGGAIVSSWGLQHASAFAFLLLRFMLAFLVLCILAAARRRWLPAVGSRRQVALTGLLLTGGYTIFYLLSLEYGITPGVLATVLGVQPILTLFILEKRISWLRLGGLLLALGGLGAIVLESLLAARFSFPGIGMTLAALLCMTLGSITQKSLRDAPLDVLPMQYAIGLGLCLLIAPFRPLHIDITLGLVIPLLYMGVLISVVATLLLYRLIQAGNLVNVTSLFYLVPGVTAGLDYVFLGNRMSLASLAGLVAIVLGLLMVFRAPATGHA